MPTVQRRERLTCRREAQVLRRMAPQDPVSRRARRERRTFPLDPMNTTQPLTDAGVDQLVSAERVAMLYRLAPRTLLTAVFFSIAVFLTLKPVTPLPVLVAWLVANNAVSLVRYLDILKYRRARPAASESRAAGCGASSRSRPSPA